jgi:SAM-dependent methyltransferase
MRLIYGNKPIRDVRCPLCLTSTGHVLYSVGPEESAGAFVRPTHDKPAYQDLVEIIRDLWNGQECRQIRCDGCASVYSWPHRAGDSRFYNLAFKEHMRYPQARWEFFAAVRFLDSQAQGGLLELGAGDGAFVRILRAHGVAAGNISVVEYSDAARRTLAGIDPSLHVFGGLEEFLDVTPPNVLSHVFAFQVLEHVETPLEYLRAFRRSLRIGGLVCLAIPNPAHIEASERNGLVKDMPPNHVTRFTVQGVSALAGQAGFELIHQEVEPLNYKEWLREFLSYHFKRRVQNEGSIQNWLEKTLPWRAATLGGALLAVPSALVYSFKPKEGASLFCVLRAV